MAYEPLTTVAGNFNSVIEGLAATGSNEAVVSAAVLGGLGYAGYRKMK